MASAPPDIALDAVVYAWGNDGPILGALDRLAVPVVAINPDDRATDVDSLRRHGVSAVIVPASATSRCSRTRPSSTAVLDEVVGSLAGSPG